MTTGRVPTTAGGRAVDLGLRAVGGAVPGATGAIITNPEDAAAGAATGAAISAFAPPVISRAIDMWQRRRPDIRADNLLRTAAGDQVNLLREMMLKYPNELPSRIAADLNLDALQAVLARAEAGDPAQVVAAFRRREAQDTLNELQRLAGGATATETRAAREGTKATLNAITTPMREEALGAAQRTGEVVPRLQAISQEARAASTKAADEVRRWSNAVNSADDWARKWVANRGVGEPNARLAAQGEQRYTYPGQLATSGRQTTVGGPFERQVIDEGGVVAGRIAQSAETSVREGARARTAEATLQSLRDRGLQPITAESLVTRLQGKLQDPAIGTNREASTAINRVVDMLNDWKNQNGVITPEALEAIRKNGVDGVIRELYPAMDEKAQRVFASRVMSNIKPMIDDAIEKAGGKGWRDYLKTFSQGMDDIRRTELADQLRDLYRNPTKANQQKIVDIVRGEAPEVIEDLFGSGRYDIATEMANDLPFLQKLGDTLSADLRAAEQATRGRAALKELESEKSFPRRFPWLSRVSTGINEATAALEAKMNAKTRQSLMRAARSGADFEKVLSAVPAKERYIFISVFPTSNDWRAYAARIAAQAGVGAAGAAAATPAPNAMNPENRNALRPQ
jgi:hypothetical protein